MSSDPVWQHDGERLRLFPRPGDGAAELRFYGGPDGRVIASVPLDPGDAGELMIAAYRATGTVPPVILGRPEVNPDEWTGFRGLKMRRSADGGVTFAIGGNRETLPAPLVRMFAAAAVAIADAAEAEPEGADELAGVLMGDGLGSADAFTAARSALRWMRGREADGERG